MTSTTQPAHAVAVAQRFVDGVAAVDAAVLRAVLHPDLETIEPSALPYGRTYHGRDAFFGELMAYVVGRFEVAVEGETKIFDGGDSAAALMTIVYTSRATGEAIRMRYVEVYRIVDGLIRQIEVFPHDAQALAVFMA
jgi:ketosteroid isomerase-like protein